MKNFSLHFIVMALRTKIKKEVGSLLTAAMLMTDKASHRSYRTCRHSWSGYCCR